VKANRLRFPAMSSAVLRRFVSVPVACALVASLSAQTKQPAIKPAALAKLAEPWPSAEELEARRVAAERRPLFVGTDAFPFTLAADFKTINKDRKVEGKVPYPGLLTVAGADGPHTIHVKLQTRGHFRLRATSCSFVPLRVEFTRDETAGTIFEGQKALKLITHCQSDREYEQFTMREYLTYRALNLLTPKSFRARLAQVSYVQSSDNKPMTSRLGMFLEDDDDVARRMEGRVMEVPRAMFKDVDQDLLTLASAFEYMIGNTDFSIYALHNFRLIRTQDRKLYAVPYDFDMSGLVNASYAIPDRAFGIKTVRDRVYRGPCRPLNEVEPILAQFRTQKANILALFDSLPDLTREMRRDARNYLEEFFRDLDRPGEVKSIFVSGRCSTKSTM
jgi:hypothetical protein